MYWIFFYALGEHVQHAPHNDTLRSNHVRHCLNDACTECSMTQVVSGIEHVFSRLGEGKYLTVSLAHTVHTLIV